MKKYLSITLLSLFLSINLLFSQDMLPSDVYYKDNIAVNNVSTKAPSLKDAGDDDDDDDGPGGNGEGDPGYVISPIGDATIPLISIGLAYAAFIVYRKKRKAIN